MPCRLNARSMCYPAWWTSALELRRLRSRPARSKLQFNLAGWGPNLYLDPNWKVPGREGPAHRTAAKQGWPITLAMTSWEAYGATPAMHPADDDSRRKRRP